MGVLLVLIKIYRNVGIVHKLSSDASFVRVPAIVKVVFQATIYHQILLYARAAQSWRVVATAIVLQIVQLACQDTIKMDSFALDV